MNEQKRLILAGVLVITGIVIMINFSGLVSILIFIAAGAVIFVDGRNIGS